MPKKRTPQEKLDVLNRLLFDLRDFAPHLPEGQQQPFLEKIDETIKAAQSMYKEQKINKFFRLAALNRKG